MSGKMAMPPTQSKMFLILGYYKTEHKTTNYWLREYKLKYTNLMFSLWKATQKEICS